MPPRPVGGGGGSPTPEDTNALLLQLAQSSQQPTVAVAAITTSQASFMRSAADADANIHYFSLNKLLRAKSTIQWMMNTEVAFRLLSILSFRKPPIRGLVSNNVVTLVTQVTGVSA